MAAPSLDYARLFAKGLPAGTQPWGGFPPYNFIGGHNNPDEIPIDDLIESSARALRQEGRELATYNMNSGPLGYTGLRAFLVEKMAHYRGIQASPSEVLITSGSNQAIELLNEVLLEPGDTVIAALGVALASGMRMKEAVRLANRAAGIVVGKFGTAVVHPHELFDSE